MRRVLVNPQTRDAVECDRCEAVRHMAIRGETTSDRRIAVEDCCWLCGLSVDQPPLDGAISAAAWSALQAESDEPTTTYSPNLQATAANVVAAWDNPSPGPEKWERLRQKIAALRAALTQQQPTSEGK